VRLISIQLERHSRERRGRALVAAASRSRKAVGANDGSEGAVGATDWTQLAELMASDKAAAVGKICELLPVSVLPLLLLWYVLKSVQRKSSSANHVAVDNETVKLCVLRL
jgi:hypothetical protein